MLNFIFRTSMRKDVHLIHGLWIKLFCQILYKKYYDMGANVMLVELYFLQSCVKFTYVIMNYTRIRFFEGITGIRFCKLFCAFTLITFDGLQTFVCVPFIWRAKHAYQETKQIRSATLHLIFFCVSCLLCRTNLQQKLFKLKILTAEIRMLLSNLSARNIGKFNFLLHDMIMAREKCNWIRL